MLDAVTNYETYKGLYSSHMDRNYFEIAYTLDRQFGPDGLYRGLPSVPFADNHDVNRVASNLTDPGRPLPALLPAVHDARRAIDLLRQRMGPRRGAHPHSDAVLRPSLDLANMTAHPPHPELVPAITRLALLRRSSPALQSGNYRRWPLITSIWPSSARRRKKP